MYSRIRRLVPRSIKDFVLFRILDGYASKSYSQEGEDMILRRFFAEKPKGFYVDVGAHHPKRFSNTFHFYKQGWSGINVDAMPGSMQQFKRQRPRDINLEIPVGPDQHSLTYYIFNETALNGFDASLSQHRASTLDSYHIERTIKLDTRSLGSILDEYLPPNTLIDFMSVDVEGMDLEVLKSNNWNKYRPEIILVEILDSSLSELKSSNVDKFLESCGYEIYAKAVNTVLYKCCSPRDMVK
jgi:FkbM family methyltransferase